MLICLSYFRLALTLVHVNADLTYWPLGNLNEICETAQVIICGPH